jgi:hypothetical protein
MKCSLCDEELDLSEIICPICNEKQDLIDGEIINFLIQQYQNYKNYIIQYSKDSYEDNYKTKAIKNTKLEVFNEVVDMLEFVIKRYTDIDVSKIEIEETPIMTPRKCQMHRSKVCDHCMDC